MSKTTWGTCWNCKGRVLKGSLHGPGICSESKAPDVTPTPTSKEEIDR